MASSIGRPAIEIDMDKVTEMRRIGMSMTKISESMGISRSTFYRTLENSDLKGFTDISNAELDEMVIGYKRNHPHDGEGMLIGFLRSNNIHIPRSRVRECIHRVDPGGVRARSIKLIQRRTYSVKGPNYVWHMDGNYKLIRWKFVIHGAVDGYSRLLTFLKCSTNNRASTVLDSFVPATQMYGVPKRLRTDMGGENIDAWEYMIGHHGGNDNCVILGSSVHNVRIERMWRDVSRSVITPFKERFTSLEDQEILDVDNEIDLFCLHEMFAHRINASLNDFVSSWNSHPLTSENNQTPLQLFCTGSNSESSESDDGSTAARIQLPTSQPAVEVSSVSFNPCILIHSQVKVLATQPSINQGCDTYEQVARCIGMHISSGCSECCFT